MNTDNEVQHSKLPYEAIINHARYADYTRSLIVANGKQIANCYIPKEESNVIKSEAEANAAFITTACNNHYALLEALKECIGELECYDLSKESYPVLAKALAIIKAAEQL